MLTFGGVLVVVVSIGIFFFLIGRSVSSLNPLNMTTLILASASGIGALIYSNHPGRLIAANALLLLAVIPTVFGWIWLLYVIPVIFVMTGTSLKIFSKSD